MNINLKRAIVGLALLFSMGMANATTTSIGDLTTYGVSGYSTFAAVGTGSFTDIYNFNLPSISDVGAGVASIYLKFGLSTWDISGLSLTLKDGINNTGTTLSSGPSFGGLTLNSGSYSFMVAGNAVGTQGGMYAFKAIAVPVPEPSSWAMMLGGFGLIGFMSYRRRQYF